MKILDFTIRLLYIKIKKVSIPGHMQTYSFYIEFLPEVTLVVCLSNCIQRPWSNAIIFRMVAGAEINQGIEVPNSITHDFCKSLYRYFYKKYLVKFIFWNYTVKR